MTDARTITLALQGRWNGRTGSACCPAHDDRNPSLSIGDADNGGLLLTCHAGCTFEEVIDALKAEGILDGTAPTDRWSPAVTEKRRRERVQAEAERIDEARAIWSETRPIQGTVAERYLTEIRGRSPDGIADLRFHPGLWYRVESMPRAIRYPCLVAPLRNIFTGKGTGVHRTFLDPVSARKIDRRMLGVARDAAIMLDPLTSVSMILAITEGIESGLAARQVMQPLWALGSAGAIGGFPVLDDVAELVIFADHDDAGMTHANRCAARWLGAGRRVRILTAKGGGDPDDELPRQSTSRAPHDTGAAA